MKPLFFDVDTQLDFVCPAGALYVPGAERLTENLTRLTGFASDHQIPILSTTDAHSEDDAEFKQWPPHCVVETAGQQKLAGTLTAKPVVVSSHPAALARLTDPIKVARQVIVQKQMLDAFTNPNLDPLLALLQPGEVFLYGVVSELCVECAAFGLLKRGLRVLLVVDAIKSLSVERETEMLRRFEAHGGVLTDTGAVMAIAANS